MNLSARLDAARRQREEGQGPKLDPHPLDLRYVSEGQTYDGREIRTGEELTPERWEELRRRDEALPAWKRHDEQPAETFADSAPLIDLTRVGPAPAAEPGTDDGPAIELPAWADGDAVVVPSTPTPPPADSGACVNCGGEPRVDVLDMLSGVAHLECTGCGFKWEAPTEPRQWPGRR